MEKNCFLFGRADTPQFILPILEQAVEQATQNGITSFYVGYHGNFDRLATTALRKIKLQYANISLNLLLSYHPNEKKVELPFGFDGTFYPPIESVPRRYAIVRANQYMVKLSDSIICYANHFGNTRNLLDFAKRQADKRNISIIDLAEQF